MVKVVAAEELPVVVRGDGNQRTAAMSGCHAENRDQPALGSAQEHQKRRDDGRRAILQPARRAAADQVAHDEPEIEAPPHELVGA